MPEVTPRRQPATDCKYGDVLAHKGEITYCENGHPLGEFARDVHWGEEASPADFILYGESFIGMQKCPVCKGRVIDTGDPDLDEWQTHYFFAVDEDK